MRFISQIWLLFWIEANFVNSVPQQKPQRTAINNKQNTIFSVCASFALFLSVYSLQFLLFCPFQVDINIVILLLMRNIYIYIIYRMRKMLRSCHTFPYVSLMDIQFPCVSLRNILSKHVNNIQVMEQYCQKRWNWASFICPFFRQLWQPQQQLLNPYKMIERNHICRFHTVNIESNTK